ncbi:type IV secretion system DNA-binding domain-containing protein [Agaribacter flavus]|uniref:Type IV secretion system DNA-binding domain-containing protein n=1 Tax=Agaribacter flavus TaxID=1902781 RepID=A0ABV7FQS0_9ALTE
MSHFKTKGKRIAEHTMVIATLSVVLFVLMEVAFLSYFNQWEELASIKEWFIEILLTVVGFANNQYINVPEVSDTFMYGSTAISLTSIALSILIVWYFRIRDFDWSHYKHLEGPRLLKGSAATKHFRKRARREGLQGLSLHPNILLPIIREAGNILVWGMQGAGKSNFIKRLVKQLLTKRERVLLYDIKGEYTQAFLNEDCVLLSPQDSRSVNWDIGKDLSTDGLAEAFAEALIPTGSTSESFWVDSARTVLVGVIVGLSNEDKPWSWCALEQRLFCGDEELSNWLNLHHKQAAKLIEPENKTTASIRSMLATKLGWLKNMTNYVSNTPPNFSVSDWLSRSDKTTLIVQGDLASPMMSSALITALMSVLSSYVLSSEDSEEQKTWLVLDELATLNKSKSIEQWLALGRSKGCRTIAGTQLLSQLHSIYGQDDANTILGLFSNVVAFKLGPNGESASKASSSFGERRVEYPVVSTNEKGEKSHSYHQESIALVTPEDLVHLPQPTLKRGISGYLLIGGSNAVYELTWPIGKYEKVAEAVIKKTTREPTHPKKSKNRLNRRASL